MSMLLEELLPDVLAGDELFRILAYDYEAIVQHLGCRRSLVYRSWPLRPTIALQDTRCEFLHRRLKDFRFFCPSLSISPRISILRWMA
jgi:hypothetical protein